MSKPVLISYCATFLKPEMLHVYRQVSQIVSFDNWVVTRTRQHAERFPFAQLVVLKKSIWRGFRRAYYKFIKRPVPLGAGEVLQLLNLAESKQAALIHIYFGTEAARALPYLQQERRPKVVSFHGADVSSSLDPADMDALIKCVDIFLARSETLAAALRQRGCPPERIRLTRTSVPIPELSPRQLPVAGQPIRLLQACRFIAKKGLDVTLDAVALLRQQGMNVYLDLAGDGPERPALEAQIKSLGLEGRVNFLGFLPNSELLSRLQDYTFFVHPSRDTAAGDREGIPNSMLEAMAAGLPVLASAHSGIPEAVESGVEGILVPQNDAQALANALTSAISDPERYAVMSQAARAKVIRCFSYQSAITELEAAYRDAIAIGASRQA